jgi:Kef-type K+ transport system membrane component KefB
MKPHDHLVFLLEILALLVSSRLLGEVFRRLRQPAVVGELLAGMLLGPSILGRFVPGVYAWLFPTPEGHLLPPALDAFSVLGVTLLMIAAGLEVDLALCLKERKATALCAVLGSVIPFLFGAAAGWIFADSWGAPPGVSRIAFAMVVAMSLALSALPVIAKTLLDLGISRTRVGTVILSAAIVDDLGVWILFSVAMSLAGHEGIEGNPVTTVILLFALLLVTFTAGRWAMNRVLPRVQSTMPWPAATVALLIASGIALACVAMWIGVHPVFGALVAGVVIGASPSLRPGSKEMVHDLVMAVFAPIFFATLGLRMDFASHFDFEIVAWTFGLGCLSKLSGAAAGARLGGVGWRESMAIAAGLNARGIMGIVLGLVALERGIIDQRMFVALAVLGVGTSLISGPLLRLALGPTPPARPAGARPAGARASDT